MILQLSRLYPGIARKLLLFSIVAVDQVALKLGNKPGSVTLKAPRP